MEPTKMRLRTRKKAGSDKALQTMTAEASPDSKCPICLDRFNNMAYLDRCLHKFCFRCIHEWSKNKAECPLCKQGFNSIFHTIKAENDFKEFVLRPVENGSFGSPGGHRFRYRTTLTRERQEARRITSSPPDNGVIFEGLAGPAPSQPDRGVRRMMTRLAARRRAQSEGRTLRALREQEVIRFRRALYRTGVRVRSVRDGGRYRDTSAEFYRRNPACLHRLVPWLKRELTVLYGAHGSLVNIVQHIIMSWITRYDMEDQAMQEELRPFLLARTDHFLHEFISFARAPFNMEAYDQHAIYDCPAPSSLEDSSSDASVIAISEDEDELDLRRGPVAGGALSQAPWDDETPGPSYSAAEQATPATLALSESESESGAEERAGPGATPQQGALVKADPAAAKDGVDSSGEEDCVIIGYVKPMVERTPELVQLSSDSEESVRNESPEAFPQPQHIRFPSLSPPSSAGSMGSKPRSPTQGQAHSHQRSEAKDGDRTSAAPGDGRPSSPWGSPPPDRCRISGETDPKGGRRHRTDRCDRSKKHRKRDRSRRRRESRSGERRPLDGTRKRSRSPTISIRSDSTLSRGRGRSRSRSRDRRPSRGGAREEGRGRDGGGARRSRSGRRDSRGRYGRERDHGHCRGRYPSSPGNPDRWKPSRSRSRTPTDPCRRDRGRSRSPSTASSRGSRSPRATGSRHDKPGGKRKYKTRHLEDPAGEDRSPGPRAQSSSSSASRAKEKRPHGEKRHGKSRGKSRSPSVEIVYEGQASGEGRRRHKKRKKHKKKSKRRKAREASPSVITINSDSDHSAGAPAAPLDLRCPESADEAPAAPGNPGDERLLESILQAWEKPTQPVGQCSGADSLKDAAAFTVDDAKHDLPVGIGEQTPASPKDETNTSSSPIISIDSHFLSCL
ncbi:topoisomerase I binding, arginine/serine-rich a [Anguilla rostrata]|uniref:topoisomerase I binding, arginine/serine-rich a n=1 Tax=Anguilla rostrata TaxID=7938 RepID=UPI0030D0CC75